MPPKLLLTKIGGCGWWELNPSTPPSALPYNPRSSPFIHKQNQPLHNIGTFLSHFHPSRLNQFKSLANIPIILADVEGNQMDNYGVLISWQILKFVLDFVNSFAKNIPLALLYNQKAIPHSNVWAVEGKK